MSLNATREPVIAFEGVRIGFDEGEVLHGVSLQVSSRETKILVGETGSGKTLLLKLADLPIVIKPSLAGKGTAAGQMLTVGVVLLGTIWPLNPHLLQVWFWFTGGLTAVSGIQYIYGGLKRVGRSHPSV